MVGRTDLVATGNGERRVAMRNFIHRIVDASPPAPSPESLQLHAVELQKPRKGTH